jgi:hypothetical protein
MDLRLADAMLVDWPLDVGRIESSDLGGLLERHDLELAGLEIDDLIVNGLSY